MIETGINLLPQDLQETEIQSRRFRRVSFICVLCLSLLGVVILVVYYFRSQVGKEWLSVKGEILDLRNYITLNENKILEGKMRVVKEKLAGLRYHFDRDEQFASFFEEFLRLITPGVQITSLKQNSVSYHHNLGQVGTILLSGRADSLEQVGSFINQLKEWERVDQVSLDLLDYQVDGMDVFFNLLVTPKIIEKS